MIYSYNKNMEIKETVGNNLRLARRAKGMTQKEAAAVLGKYQPDYSHDEMAKTELDNEKKLGRCTRYDITPNDLFDGLV